MRAPILRPIGLAGAMLLLLVAKLASGTLPARIAAPADRPVIDLEQTVCNLGRVLRGSDARGEFVIHNRGASRLIVHEDRDRCDCVGDVIAEPVVIAPGRSAVLQPRLLVPRRSEPGALEQRVRYRTSSRELPSFTVYMQAEVVD